jgi:hypothetical protein
MYMNHHGVQHNLVRATALVAPPCAVCADAWPVTTGVVAKSYSCQSCGECYSLQHNIILLQFTSYSNLLGIFVHSDCKSLACKLSCSSSPINHIGNIDLTQAVFGTVTVKLIHAYDLNFAPNGTAIYGVFQLKGDNIFSKRSAEAVSGDNDCVWDNGANQGLSEDRDCVLPVAGTYFSRKNPVCIS